MTEEKKEENKIQEEAEENKDASAEASGKQESSQQEGGEEEKKPVSSEADSSAKEEKEEGAKNDEEEKVEVPEKFKALVEEIEKMSVLDLAELVKILEKKFGVSAAAQVVAAPAGGQAAGEKAGETEEKSVFKVELKGIGDKKIEVIKVVRDLMGKGLKEAKDLVDAVAGGPQVIKENVKKEEAEEIKKKFEAAGATVDLK